jgi:MFS family permease
MQTPDAGPRPALTLTLVVIGTVLGLMGTDLVLPAVPSLPETLGGDAADAQMVLAAYVAGTCAGLLAFGSLADRVATRTLFLLSLLGTAAASFACATAPDIGTLVAFRAVQGAVASGPAVFAPGIVRASLGEARAVRALGLLGSIESLVPALAPLVGVALLWAAGWRGSFSAMGVLALALALVAWRTDLLPQAMRRTDGGYARLLRNPVYLRYAASQALVLGGLLVFVFGMPAVFVRALGGGIGDFVVMQATGISIFIVAANFASRAAGRFGTERMITVGTLTSTAGGVAIALYALAGGTGTFAIAAPWVLVNVGLGLRGPPGFHRAIVAAGGDDARGSALVILGVLGTTAAGTAAVAPMIEAGLLPLATAAAACHLAALACLVALPRMETDGR